MGLAEFPKVDTDQRESHIEPFAQLSLDATVEDIANAVRAFLRAKEPMFVAQSMKRMSQHGSNDRGLEPLVRPRTTI